MKKIIRQVAELCPNKFVKITNEVCVHPSGDETVRYFVYINDDEKLWPSTDKKWTNPLNSLKDVDKLLVAELEGYKSVYA